MSARPRREAGLAELLLVIAVQLAIVSWQGAVGLALVAALLSRRGAGGHAVAHSRRLPALSSTAARAAGDVVSSPHSSQSSGALACSVSPSSVRPTM